MGHADDDRHPDLTRESLLETQEEGVTMSPRFLTAAHGMNPHDGLQVHAEIAPAVHPFRGP